MRGSRRRASAAAESSSDGSSEASYCLYTTVCPGPNWSVCTRSTDALSSSWMRMRWRAPYRQRPPAASQIRQCLQQQTSFGRRGLLDGDVSLLMRGTRKEQCSVSQLPERMHVLETRQVATPERQMSGSDAAAALSRQLAGRTQSLGRTVPRKATGAA